MLLRLPHPHLSSVRYTTLILYVPEVRQMVHGALLEECPQVGNRRDGEEGLAVERLSQPLVLEAPSVRMRHQDRVQAHLKRRVDVGPRGVSNHPRTLHIKSELLQHLTVRVGILLWNDDGLLKPGLQT